MTIRESLKKAQDAKDGVGTGVLSIKDGEGEIQDVVLDYEVKDPEWGDLFRLFNYDPKDYEVVGAVNHRTWQRAVPATQGGGVEQLYAYSCRFRVRSPGRISEETRAGWLKDLKKFKWQPEFDESFSGTYVVLIADPQLGKKGTDQAKDNWRRGVIGHLNKINALMLLGIGPSQIHIAFMGDETEGVCNHYVNQVHTIELNQSEQLEEDFNLRVWTIKQFAALGLPISASSVLSNHGEWTRNGGRDPVTTRADNASTFIARQVKALFEESEPYTGLHIDWEIADSDPGITLTLSGVKVYLSHGYIEKGRGGSTGGSEARVKAAMERQILGRTEQLGDVQVYLTAHYHHFHCQEFEGRTLFGCPALEAEKSSEYMLDQFGVWSPPGMLGMILSDKNSRGWNEVAVY